MLFADVAEKVFMCCTTSNMNNSDHPNYEITFNYEFLDDMYATWRDADSGDAMSSLGKAFRICKFNVVTEVHCYSHQYIVRKSL